MTPRFGHAKRGATCKQRRGAVRNDHSRRSIQHSLCHNPSHSSEGFRSASGAKASPKTRCFKSFASKKFRSAYDGGASGQFRWVSMHCGYVLAAHGVGQTFIPNPKPHTPTPRPPRPAGGVTCRARAKSAGMEGRTFTRVGTKDRYPSPEW